MILGYLLQIEAIKEEQQVSEVMTVWEASTFFQLGILLLAFMFIIPFKGSFERLEMEVQIEKEKKENAKENYSIKLWQLCIHQPNDDVPVYNDAMLANDNIHL